MPRLKYDGVRRVWILERAPRAYAPARWDGSAELARTHLRWW